MAKPLVLKKGITVQALVNEIDPSCIGFDAANVYPENSLPKALTEKANVIVRTTEPTASEVNENDIIIVVDP